MKRSIPILLIICILSIGALALSSSDLTDERVKLGDGCGGTANEVATCDDFSNCYWRCTDDNTREWVCTEAHGWCEGNGAECGACDFVTLDDIHVCETQTITQANNELISGSKQCFPNANPNPLSEDPDLITQSQTIVSCDDGKFKNTGINVFSEYVEACNEVNINTNSLWVYDHDADDYYSHISVDKLSLPPRSPEQTFTFTQPSDIIGSYTTTNLKNWRRFPSSLQWEEGCEDYNNNMNDVNAFLRCKQASNDSEITPVSLFCKDEDNDLYGESCVTARSLNDDDVVGDTSTYKPIHKLTNSIGDCDDDDPDVQLLYYGQDEENNAGDDYFGIVVKSC